MVYNWKLSKLKFQHYGSWFQALTLRNSKTKVSFQFNIFTDGKLTLSAQPNNPLIKPRYNKTSPFVSSARLILANFGSLVSEAAPVRGQ